MTTLLPNWPYVYGSPFSTGVIRQYPEDFIVTENLVFTPSGNGEHVFLQIQKTSENTEFIARQLARFAGVRQRDIGYAGLKDRHAVTSQWFSIWLPGKANLPWEQFNSENVKVLQHLRHNKKLKRGVLSSNHFKITVRHWQGEHTKTITQLSAIKSSGIANYYGEQRFGHNGNNLNKALTMFQGAKVDRELRSIYLSAVRSFLFNQLLAQRVLAGTWNQALIGDVFMFDCSHSYFKTEQLDDDIIQRVAQQLIHPTALLWGVAKPTPMLTTMEQEVFERYPELVQGLIASGVELSRRALRVNLPDLHWQFVEHDKLVLEFSLPAGCFATAVLREIIRCVDNDQPSVR